MAVASRALNERKQEAAHQWVPIDQIRFNPLNFYGIFKRSQRIDWLRDAYERRGRFINEPIVAIDSDSSYLCICGEGRIRSIEGTTDKVYCLVLDGLSEEQSMAILAEDNATQVAEVRPARAIESYFLYLDVLRTSHSADHAIRYVSVTYANTQSVKHTQVIPGWLMAHSSYLWWLMERAGYDRHNLDDIALEREQFISMPVYALREIARPFWPVRDSELLSAPDERDVVNFDGLIQEYVENEMTSLSEDEFLKQCRNALANAVQERVDRLYERAVASPSDRDGHQIALGCRREVSRLSRIQYLTDAEREGIMMTAQLMPNPSPQKPRKVDPVAVAAPGVYPSRKS